MVPGDGPCCLLLLPEMSPIFSFDRSCFFQFYYSPFYSFSTGSIPLSTCVLSSGYHSSTEVCNCKITKLIVAVELVSSMLCYLFCSDTASTLRPSVMVRVVAACEKRARGRQLRWPIRKTLLNTLKQLHPSSSSSSRCCPESFQLLLISIGESVGML